MEYDNVSKPKHYNIGASDLTRHILSKLGVTKFDCECIEVTENLDFCLGNAIKYLWRSEQKGNTIEDLKKAQWYLDRSLQTWEHSGHMSAQGDIIRLINNLESEQ